MSMVRSVISKLDRARKWSARTFLRPTNVIVLSWSPADLDTLATADRVPGGAATLRDHLHTTDRTSLT